MIYFLSVIAVLYGIALLSLCWNYWQAVRLVQEQPKLDEVGSLANPPPKLDVVIPVKDEENNIAQCVESVLAQDYPDFRLIVVNDRSTDGTAEVLQKRGAKTLR